MATYEESGVNISLGDECSKIAYTAAMNTFKGRSDMIGEPMKDEGGFSGMLNMGDFYLVQNDDGVGTKIEIAERISKYDTLGYDLLAMVLDDAICVGAEPISVTNTLDVDKLDSKKISALMTGLQKASLEHKIVIPGGEIAELGNAVNGYLWNATVVGVVEKNKVITGENIASGDKLIALHSDGFRSNGFSLIRHILANEYGEDWADKEYSEGITWGEQLLIPSKIYSSAVMEMHGRYGEAAKVNLKGVVHVTGGGIHGNLHRIMKKTKFKAKIDNLPKAHKMMLKLMEIGDVSEDEAYKTWNMGVGMILISQNYEEIASICEKHGIKTSIIGKIE